MSYSLQTMSAFSDALAAVESATTEKEVLAARAQFSNSAVAYKETYLTERVDAHAATRSHVISRLDSQASKSHAKGVRGLADFMKLRACGLTKRECEVMFWISKGKSDAELAVILGCASRTVSKHVENLLEKLKSKTRLMAVRTVRTWLQRSD